jgi:hypothetical protein
MDETLKDLNKEKKYTLDQLKKKYAGKYIQVSYHHYDYWNDTINKFETVYKVIKVGTTEKESFTLPAEIL